MAHKRYRNPDKGYERRQQREEARAVVEEELFDAVAPAEPTPQSGIAEHMATDVPSTPRGKDDTADALGGLDLDGLVSHDMGVEQAAAPLKSLADLQFANAPAPAEPLAQPAPEPTAAAATAPQEPSVQDRAANAGPDEATRPGIENRRVTRVHMGAASARKQKRGGLSGFVNRLLGRG